MILDSLPLPLLLLSLVVVLLVQVGCIAGKGAALPNNRATELERGRRWLNPSAAGRNQVSPQLCVRGPKERTGSFIIHTCRLACRVPIRGQLHRRSGAWNGEAISGGVTLLASALHEHTTAHKQSRQFHCRFPSLLFSPAAMISVQQRGLMLHT